jgi:hypothetical protein
MFGGLIRGPIQNPEAYAERVYWWIIGFTCLIVGLVFFAIFAWVAFTGIIDCGLHCDDRNIIEIFFGGFQYFGTCCIGLILLIIGAVIFGIFRWGMFLDGRAWRRPYERHRHP